jgi:hypothetical protein
MYKALLNSVANQQTIGVHYKQRNSGFAVPVTSDDFETVAAKESWDYEKLFNWLNTIGVAYFEGRPIKQQLLIAILHNLSHFQSRKLVIELIEELKSFAAAENIF